MKVTATDVAKLAGVSQSTVSRVFFGDVNVSEKSRQKVLQAAEQLGYSPNEFARSLITNKSKLIGIVMKNVQNPFYQAVLKQFTTAWNARGYNILYIQTEHDEIQKEDIATLLNYKVAGIVIADATSSLKVLEDLHKHKMPVVLFNRSFETAQAFSVCTNNEAASEQIMRKLLQKGCSSFAFIGGIENASTNMERARGFFKIAQHYPHTMRYADFTYEGGFTAAKEIVATGNIPSAFVVANDLMALGIIDALREKNIGIPNETKVVGFDNIDLASWPSYRLTTWEQPIDEMVDIAVHYLLQQIEQYTGATGAMKVSGKLIERSTT